MAAEVVSACERFRLNGSILMEQCAEYAAKPAWMSLARLEFEVLLVLSCE